MTKQEMLVEIEAKIRKDIPRLMELREGCYLMNHATEKMYKIINVDGEICFLADVKNYKLSLLEITKSTAENYFKIIGHDIMLNDVLEWFRLNDLVVVTQCNKNESLMALFYVEYDEDGRYLYEIHASWNLPHACLKDQPEEVIKFLYNVKK